MNKNKNENNYHNVLIVDQMVGIKPIVSRKVSVVTGNIFPLSSYPYGFYKNPATSYYNSPPWYIPGYIKITTSNYDIILEENSPSRY